MCCSFGAIIVGICANDFIYILNSTFTITILNQMNDQIYLILLTELQYIKHILLCKNVSLMKERFSRNDKCKVSFISCASIINLFTIFLFLLEQFC